MTARGTINASPAFVWDDRALISTGSRPVPQPNRPARVVCASAPSWDSGSLAGTTTNVNPPARARGFVDPWEYPRYLPPTEITLTPRQSPSVTITALPGTVGVILPGPVAGTTITALPGDISATAQAPPANIIITAVAGAVFGTTTPAIGYLYENVGVSVAGSGRWGRVFVRSPNDQEATAYLYENVT